MVASKSTKSKLWFVRMDGPEEHLRQKCGVLSQALDTVAMIAAFHKGNRGENPHCHICIEVQSEIQKQSFAVRLKTLFGIVSKSQYALDIWDGNRGKGAVSYLFHETEEKILVNKGFSDQELMDARKANEAVQAVVSVNKEKSSHKLVERALEEFKDVEDKWLLRSRILKFMVSECRDGQVYWPGSFMLKKYVEEVEVRLLKGEQELDVFVSELEKSLWR